MKRNFILGLVFVGIYLIFSAASGHAKGKPQVYAPLPKAIIEAKTVSIDNQYGDPRTGDIAYQTLTEWQRFKVVDYSEKPDLVIRFRAITTQRAPDPPPATVQNNNTVVIVNSNVVARQPYVFNPTPVHIPVDETVYYVAMDVINPADSVVLWSVIQQARPYRNPKNSGAYACLAQLAMRMPENQKEKK